MTTKEFVVKPLQIPDDGTKVILEYIIVKYTRSSFLSKTYVVDTEPKSHNGKKLKEYISVYIFSNSIAILRLLTYYIF
jgi:hypothetical protein